MKKSSLLVVGLSTLLTFSSGLALATSAPMPSRAEFAAGYPEAAPVTIKEMSFADIVRRDIELKGTKDTASVNFSNRADEIITDLTLSFSYVHSPALLPRLSHIRVFLNNAIMATFPVLDVDEQAVQDQVITRQVKLDANLIRDFNELRFELIGHYSLDCEDPFHSSIWTNISQSSFVSMTTHKLPVESDLSYFPEPFFDKRDYGKLTMPMVLVDHPDLNTIKAAGIAASWFGAQANWRNSAFPVVTDALPDRHAVVFASNDNKPAFLLDHPDVDGPTIEVIANPEHRYQKLLLVLGRNSDDLVTAATGMALGHVMMTGRSGVINHIDYIAPRKPYDAPRWLRNDRPVAFSELTEYPEQLQVSGYDADPVTLDFRLPPDLFTWQSEGIPIELAYRYSPPSSVGESRLNMNINNKFVQGYKLDDKGKTVQSQDSFSLPFMGDEDAEFKYFDIPGIKLENRNQVAFKFAFSTARQGECMTSQPVAMKASVDGNSVIDISDFSNYIALPDLNVFAQSGFPFSRMADLSETLLLLSDDPSRKEIETLLTLLGHISASTGYPAVKVSISQPNLKPDFEDKDILLVGEFADVFAEKDWDEHPDVLIDGAKRVLSYSRFGQEQHQHEQQAAELAHRVTLTSNGDIAAFVGFESPYSNKRSVVALLASSAAGVDLANQALLDNGQRVHIKNAVTVLKGDQIQNFQLDEYYYVGSLKIWTLIRYHLSGHPILIAITSIFLLIVLSFMLWRMLQTLARKRLQAKEKF